MVLAQPQTIYSAFTVKFLANASISTLTGQPMLMHKNSHATNAFINGDAL